MKYLMIVFSLFLFINSLSAQNIYENPNPLWKATEDDVYLQEASNIITTDNPITSVGELNGQLFAVMDKTIYRAEENGL
ncbi:MAG: hypothetical protein ABFS12_12900, partial [Bacteroidota bacterium]